MNEKYDNSNRGVLFRNEEPKKNPDGPDYSGNFSLKCPHCQKESDHRLAGWKREAKATGKKFLSLAATLISDEDKAKGEKKKQAAPKAETLPDFE